MPTTTRQLRSLITEDGRLELSIATVPVDEPGPDEVVVRIEATPINPSDLGLLFGAADMATATATEAGDGPAVTATVPPGLMRSMSGRVGQSLPVGNEGAGVVVAAGSSDGAEALLGRTVAVLGGAMYADYRTLKVSQCLELHEGTTPAQGASCFVNPLTALGMVETMRREGHHALVHTAAASNLGQMLVRICAADGIDLVNIVRREEQEELLRSIGATYVCNSSSPSFMDDLTGALTATRATIGFDATGGGELAGQILTCMEAAANANATEYSRYGSNTYKQVYIYGGLDRGPTILRRNFGFSWGVGGWLLTPFLQKIGPDAAQALRRRVADEVTTTFASTYTKEISLPEVLSLDEIAVYGKQATGQKYLVNPTRG